MESSGKVLSIKSLDGTKDLAIKTVAVATGEEDVFIDVETADYRLEMSVGHGPEDGYIDILLENIERAKAVGADYLHLY
jgi:pyruvate carboxylase